MEKTKKVPNKVESKKNSSLKLNSPSLMKNKDT